VNAAVALEPSGAIRFVPGELYRLVLRVTGPTAVEDLEQVLRSFGFAADSLVASHPRDWTHERPPDWPPEAAIALEAGQCLVRASGYFEPEDRRPAELGETAVGEGAHFGIAQAWTYTPRAEHAGAGAPETPKKSLMGPGGVALLSGGVLIGLGLWSSARRRARIDAETKRLFTTVAEQETSELDAQAAVLEGQGLPREHARVLAEKELRERLAIRELELEEG
jgi:hypothetical protein